MNNSGAPFFTHTPSATNKQLNSKSALMKCLGCKYHKKVGESKREKSRDTTLIGKTAQRNRVLEYITTMLHHAQFYCYKYAFIIVAHKQKYYAGPNKVVAAREAFSESRAAKTGLVFPFLMQRIYKTPKLPKLVRLKHY